MSPAALLLAASIWAAKPAGAPAWLDSIAVVEATEGDLTAGGRPVRAGFYARPGVRLELAAGGRAVLRISEIGHMRLEGPASFEVAAGRKPGLSVLRGKLLAVLPGLRGRFFVKARELVASVRGTDFFMDVRGAHETYLCVCSGIVEVSDGKGFRKAISGEHHNPFMFRPQAGGIWQQEHAMIEHSDDEIAALKALPLSR